MNQKDTWRVAEATTKGLIASMPLVGPLLAEYYNLAKEAVLEKRFVEWKNIVEDKLSDIQEDIDKLSSDGFFFSCFQIATASALKAHKREKLEMFAAALFNTLEFPDLSEDKKLFFITLLDKYTVNTLRLLAFFSRKKEYERTSRRGMMKTEIIGGTEHPIKHIQENFPEFEEDDSYVQSIANQLASDGLIYQIKWGEPISPESARSKKTTNMGDEFLAFIEAGDLK